MIDYPNKLNLIFDKLQKNNISPVIVGGYVRDFLLKIASKDIDVEVYNIQNINLLQKLLQEFGSVNNVGRSFGVCKLNFENLEIDFTLPRIENKISAGHKGFKIQIEKNIDFIVASKRRDFTINAIGYDVINKKILDPFHGIKDLQNKTLRVVSPKTFVEDPLRILRALQFASRFELKVDQELKILILSMMQDKLLDEIATERIYIEFQKLLLKSKKPSIGFRLLKELKVIDHFKELKFISESSKYEKLLSSLDHFTKNKPEDEKRGMILAFSVISFYIQSDDLTNFLKRFTKSISFIDAVTTLLRYKDVTKEDIDQYKLLKLSTHIQLETLFQFLNIVYHKDQTILKKLKFAQSMAKELHILKAPPKPLLRGKDLLNSNIAPSKEYSLILAKAYDAQLKNEFTTYEEALTWLREELTL